MSKPTHIFIAPRGHSFHGLKIKPDETGVLVKPNIEPNVQALLDALTAIVTETMDHRPAPVRLDDSYIPRELIEQAQQALAAYGLRVMPIASTVAA